MKSLDQNLEFVKNLILKKLSPYKVRIYFFGSRAKGNAQPTSDIDIAILPLEPLPLGVLSLLREELEESTIPYTVDIVDITKTSARFKKQIQQEGTLWKS